LLPPDVIPYLVASTKGKDSRLVEGAAIGSARIANQSPAAAEALAEALLANHNAVTKQFVMKAIASNKVISARVQDALAELLATTTNADVLVEALSTAAAFGPDATVGLVNRVTQMDTKTLDRRVAEAAESAVASWRKLGNAVCHVTGSSKLCCECLYSPVGVSFVRMRPNSRSHQEDALGLQPSASRSTTAHAGAALCGTPLLH